MTELEQLAEIIRANRYSPALSVSTNLLRLKAIGDALVSASNLMLEDEEGKKQGDAEWEAWLEELSVENIWKQCLCLSLNWKTAQIYQEHEQEIILAGIIKLIGDHKRHMGRKK